MPTRSPSYANGHANGAPPNGTPSSPAAHAVATGDDVDDKDDSELEEDTEMPENDESDDDGLANPMDLAGWTTAQLIDLLGAHANLEAGRQNYAIIAALSRMLGIAVPPYTPGPFEQRFLELAPVHLILAELEAREVDVATAFTAEE